MSTGSTLSRLKDLLGRAPAYIAVQRALGADRVRYRCIDELALRPGATVVDVGCGPAYYFERLPQPLTYHGFDTEARYIDWARKRWSHLGTFHLGVFDADAARALAPVDAVMLLGLLHHLPDAQALDLLELSARALGPAGQVIAVDPCFEPAQGRISRWMSENDRGEHVREPAAFVALASTWFGSVDGQVLSDVSRIPTTHWMMRLTGPRVTVAGSDGHHRG
jgi:SAM-dependent methyltransferase